MPRFLPFGWSLEATLIVGGSLDRLLDMNGGLFDADDATIGGPIDPLLATIGGLFDDDDATIGGPLGRLFAKNGGLVSTLGIDLRLLISGGGGGILAVGDMLLGFLLLSTSSSSLKCLRLILSIGFDLRVFEEDDFFIELITSGGIIDISCF
jgi:hypothetical protein